MTSTETLSAVGNTSLFIIFGILTGIIFAPVIAYFGQLFERHDASTKTNYFLRTTWILAGIFTLALFYLLLFYTPINDKDSNPALALAPLGMMIAALIASASVMKNIAETKANEVKKHEKEDSKFYLEQCIKTLEHVSDLLTTQQNNPLSWKEAAEMLIDMRTISQYITKEPHKKVFTLEYRKYSSKLLNSFTKTSFMEESNPLLPSFFCFISDWQKTNLNEAFEKSTIKMNPEYIVTIFQFAQLGNNTFLENTTDNKDWYKIDFDQLKNQLPWMCAIDYIELYKEREFYK